MVLLLLISWILFFPMIWILLVIVLIIFFLCYRFCFCLCLNFSIFLDSNNFLFLLNYQFVIQWKFLLWLGLIFKIEFPHYILLRLYELNLQKHILGMKSHIKALRDIVQSLL